MNIKGIEWVECSKEETESLKVNEFAIFVTNNKSTYFKKKEIFPIVFEDSYKRFKVNEFGEIVVEIIAYNNLPNRFSQSLPTLYKAVEKSKELRNKK